MFKSFKFLLLVHIFSCSIFVSNNFIMRNSKKPEGFAALNKVLVTLLETCDLQIRHIVIYDNSSNPSTANALSAFQPQISLTARTNLVGERTHVPMIYHEPVGLIMIVDMAGRWTMVHKNMIVFWQLHSNSTIIIMPKPDISCKFAQEAFRPMVGFGISRIYYICLKNHTQPVIVTHDPYGDTEPRYWQKIYQQLNNVNLWTVYERNFDEANTCLGFTFDRVNTIPTVIGLSKVDFNESLRNSISDERYYKNEDITQDKISPYLYENLEMLEKLLNRKFEYYVKMTESAKHIDQFYDYITNTPINVIVRMYPTAPHRNNWRLTSPIYYNYIAILTKNRGFLTPLEKIAAFYGIWTLISLAIILTTTIIVIWLKTGKNIFFAAFDILRLLINTNIFVPINTITLKIFFSMIFLYFLIIHSTFSGNLVKFLTSIELRKNIDSIDDLKDPQIRSISTSAFDVENIQDIQTKELIKNKTINVLRVMDCANSVKNSNNFACIGPFELLQSFVATNYDGNDTFYISKNKITPLACSLLYRNHFALKEEFNRALMTLFELQLYNQVAYMELKREIASMALHKARSQTNFRAINMNDVKFAFIFLLIGNGLGFICFLIELLINRKCYLPRNRKNRNILKNCKMKAWQKQRFKKVRFRKRHFDITNSL